MAFTKWVWAGAVLLAATVSVIPTLRAQEPAPEASRKVLRKVLPAYPSIARQWHLTATVKLIATVTRDGAVRSVKTLGGSPVFVPLAEVAVKQWKYEVSSKETIEPVVLIFSETP
jgi:outer membrane biosynthesis protein TonB